MTASALWSALEPCDIATWHDFRKTINWRKGEKRNDSAWGGGGGTKYCMQVETFSICLYTNNLVYGVPAHHIFTVIAIHKIPFADFFIFFVTFCSGQSDHRVALEPSGFNSVPKSRDVCCLHPYIVVSKLFVDVLAADSGDVSRTFHADKNDASAGLTAMWVINKHLPPFVCEECSFGGLVS